MKTFLMICGIVWGSFSAHAADPAQGAIDCVSRDSASFPGVEFTLKARLAIISAQNEGSMWDVIATARDSETGEGEIQTGRRDYLDAEPNYKPRKYKNHTKFDLTKLTDTKTFGRYEPLYDCYLDFLVPNDGISKKTFAAPMVISCDQGGGSVTLDCKVTPRK